MPHSLRSKIKKLRYKGIISDKDCNRLCKALDNEGVLDKIKAEQEPKTGHWITNAPQYDMLNPQYICSECGNAHTRTTPYCEMCGAKMEVEE